MVIRTTIQPFVLWRNTIFAILCAIFGLWGWYDYSIKIPALEVDCETFDQAKETIKKLETQSNTAQLNSTQTAEYAAAKKNVDEITARNVGAPTKPSQYDRPMQLWLYIIGCGMLGTPFFIWPILQTTKKRYELQDNGTLLSPQGTFTVDQIAEIEMNRWCAKEGDRRSTWTATVVTTDGKRILLDDHDFKNMHLIIGAIANRMMPDKWTADAKRISEQTEAEVASANEAV
ncbi:MAG: hypothetical protein EXS12_06840 [Phycisphaerales bacterium]|nr:hypothetical protein [Phycisphaerales bacterium]